MKIDFSETGTAAVSLSSPPQRPAPHLSFDLPRMVHQHLVLATAAYLAVMGTAFRAGNGIGLLFVVFAVVMVGYFALPVLMQRQSGPAHSEPKRKGAWGIDTASGYLSGRAAYVQVMTVPLLMLFWAVAVAFIVA
ncbi:hypothetical protein [Sandarakinorhabdus sp.]|uniref:hypothetical protein n=1 Tax=Sandarakinorhabdus sp. TaxID=1916663 RepID=UPI00286E7430|nr:hypothetical protein [Sandarakinorhabdus sp.]